MQKKHFRAYLGEPGLRMKRLFPEIGGAAFLGVLSGARHFYGACIRVPDFWKLSVGGDQLIHEL